MSYTYGKKMHKVRTTILNVVSSIVLLGSSLGTAAPLLFSQKAFADTPSDLYVNQAGTGDCSTLADACGAINTAVTAATTGTVIHVAAGTYQENINVNKPVSLIGTDGAANTIIAASNPDSSTLTFSTSNATVSGFTITHAYAPDIAANWNSIGGNNKGVDFGQTTHDNILENSTITLNRNGVYLNNSHDNTITHNVITNNRTGINMINDLHGTDITGNTISNNWTEGIVSYGAGIPIDYSTITVTGNTFDQNWYEEITVKDASANTGTLDVTANTFTDTPVTYTTSTNPALNEPGFAAQIPAVTGVNGTATKPTKELPTLRIYNSGSVVLKYTPKTLLVGADEPYTTVQAAVNDASAGDTVSLTEDVTTDSQINVTTPITIAGNGHIISPSNAVPVNTAVIALTGADGTHISNLTIDGINGVKLNGVNAFKSAAILDGVTLKNNDKYGLVVNSSNVTVNNITTSGNAWGGIDVDQNNASSAWPAALTVNGTSTHTEAGADIYIDDTTKPVTVTDTNSQYTSQHTGAQPNDLTYKLKPAIPVAPTDLHAKFQNDSTDTANGSYLNIKAKPGNNNLELLWYTPTSTVTGYHILATYPDGTTNLSYQGPNTNTWLNNNGFGQHGNGAYTYRVVAVNGSGESSPSADFTLYYDTQGPTATFTQAPAENSTAKGIFHVTATASDNVALKDVTFDVRDSSGWKASCVTGSLAISYSSDHKIATLSCDINTSGLTDSSTYYVRVHASDNVGYGSADVAPTSIRHFTVDRTLPTVEITSPKNQAVKGSTVTIKGSANDNADFNYFYCYVTLPGSSEVGVRGADCNTTWHSVTNGTLGTVNLAGLPDGNYEAHLVAYDKAGNHSDINYAVPFVLDNTRPSLAFTAPTDFSTPFQTGPTVAVHGSDANGLSVLSIHVYNSTGVLQHTACSATAAELVSGNLSCDLSGLADGTYYVKAGENDTAGNNQTITSANFTIDNTAPAVPANLRLTANSNNSSVPNNGTTNSFSVTADWDGVSDADHYQYKIWTDISSSSNHSEATASIIYVAGTSQSGTFNEGDGTHHIEVRSVDAAGNTSAWSSPFIVTYDSTAPSEPVATPGAGNYTSAQLVSLDSSDDGSGLAGIYYTTDGSTPSSTNGTVYTGAIAVNSSETIRAIAYDAAGTPSTVLTAAYTINLPVTPSLVTSSLSSFVSSTLPQGGRGGGNGTNGTPVPQNNGATTAVLGASTTTPNTSDGHVKGASTTALAVKNPGSTTTKSSNFLGLGWWWLIVLAAAGFFFALAKRRSADDQN